MIKRVTILMLLAAVSLAVLKATAQEADILRYNNDWSEKIKRIR